MLRIFLICLLLCAQAACAATEPRPEPLDNFPQTVLEIGTPDARVHRFKVWIADTDARRQQGLMFVRNLAADTGMLFVFPAPARVGFWMKNTFVPLDMLFVRADGHIDSVAADATPGSLQVIESKSDQILAVLEVRAGLARELGIGSGGVLVKPPLHASAR